MQTPGALVAHSWCAPGSLLVRSWPTPGALLAHSWCAPGLLLVRSWPTPAAGSLLVRSWPTPGALLAHSWCALGPLLVRSWPTPGALRAHFLCASGALLVLSLHTFDAFPDPVRAYQETLLCTDNKKPHKNYTELYGDKSGFVFIYTELKPGAFFRFPLPNVCSRLYIYTRGTCAWAHKIIP